jgi:hypothetical protein
VPVCTVSARLSRNPFVYERLLFGNERTNDVGARGFWLPCLLNASLSDRMLESLALGGARAELFSRIFQKLFW